MVGERVEEVLISHSLSEITVFGSGCQFCLAEDVVLEIGWRQGKLNVRPLYQVGYIIAGSEGSPNVLYAIFAEGMISPDLSVKSPRS